VPFLQIFAKNHEKKIKKKSKKLEKIVIFDPFLRGQNVIFGFNTITTQKNI